jgi:hypothetical protein
MPRALPRGRRPGEGGRALLSKAARLDFAPTQAKASRLILPRATCHLLPPCFPVPHAHLKRRRAAAPGRPRPVGRGAARRADTARALWCAPAHQRAHRPPPPLVRAPAPYARAAAHARGRGLSARPAERRLCVPAALAAPLITTLAQAPRSNLAPPTHPARAPCPFAAQTPLRPRTTDGAAASPTASRLRMHQHAPNGAVLRKSPSAVTPHDRGSYKNVRHQGSWGPRRPRRSGRTLSQRGRGPRPAAAAHAPRLCGSPLSGVCAAPPLAMLDQSTRRRGRGRGLSALHRGPGPATGARRRARAARACAAAGRRRRPAAARRRAAAARLRARIEGRGRGGGAVAGQRGGGAADAACTSAAAALRPRAAPSSGSVSRIQSSSTTSIRKGSISSDVGSVRLMAYRWRVGAARSARRAARGARAGRLRRRPRLARRPIGRPGRARVLGSARGRRTRAARGTGGREAIWRFE